MKPLSIKEKAIDYRKQGYSYQMISKELGLSKSTLSDWLKEIPYVPNALVLERIQLAPAKSGQIAHDKRQKETKYIKEVAFRELGNLTRRDLWLLGIGIYLGEGTKLQESVKIINADPQIIKLTIKWLTEICGLTIENLTIAIHIYPDNDIEETVSYWSQITGIPLSQFGKTQIDRRLNKTNKKKRKLPYGTAHLKVKSNGNKKFGVQLHRRIIGWIEAIYNASIV